jgi:hypothetical protein
MTSPSPHPGFSRLQQILETRHRELMAYANRLDARQGYVDKENAHLEALQTALSELMPLLNQPSLRFASTWDQAEEALLELIQADPQLAGITFSLRLRPQGRHFAIVQL